MKDSSNCEQTLRACPTQNIPPHIRTVSLPTLVSDRLSVLSAVSLSTAERMATSPIRGMLVSSNVCRGENQGRPGEGQGR